MDMTLEGSADKIRCPTLVTSGTTDHFDPGAVQAQALYNHLTCEKDLMIYSNEYGAGTHCQLGAFGQSFAGKFDWLDERLAVSG
jgi:cephalosporin-C deacetylase-like acetyl esterase